MMRDTDGCYAILKKQRFPASMRVNCFLPLVHDMLKVKGFNLFATVY